MLFLALIIFLLALILLWLAKRGQLAIGMPGGKIVYSDTQQWRPVEKSLHDPILGLTGKPDYLVKQGKQVIPIEVKSKRIAKGPYDSHIYQLAAYCILVTRESGIRPDYGILHYPNRTFRIDYTPELEATTLDLLIEIHKQNRRKEIHRSHEVPARCVKCGYRSICEDRLDSTI
jgi:CRISPR-associated exonuclease Cas4